MEPPLQTASLRAYDHQVATAYRLKGTRGHHAWVSVWKRTELAGTFGHYCHDTSDTTAAQRNATTTEQEYYRQGRVHRRNRIAPPVMENWPIRDRPSPFDGFMR